MAKWITSPKSQAFKDYRKLLSPHGLKKSSHYLLSGNKVLQELLSMDPDSVTEALYPSEEMASTWQVPGPVLAAELFKEIDVMGTGGPIFCVKKQELATWQPQPPRGLTVFSPLGDPRNVGALLRSSLAFGADQVVLLFLYTKNRSSGLRDRSPISQ